MTSVVADCDALLREGEQLRFTYRSGLIVYTEALIDGRFLSRGWNAAGYVDPEGVEFDAGASSEAAAFVLEIDGQLLASHWRFESFDTTRTEIGVTAEVRLRHEHRPVVVTVCTALDGTPVFRRWLEIENDSEQPAAISQAAPCSGVLWHRPPWEAVGVGDSPARFSVGSMADSRWGHEGQFEWQPLSPGGTSRVAGGRRSPSHRHPAFVLRSETTGEHFIGQLEWSGPFAFDFFYETTPEPTGQRRPVAIPRVSLVAGPDAPAPQRVLDPGEKVSSPALHLGLVLADLDAAVNAMTAHVRRSVLRRDPRNFCLIESGIGPEVSITPESVHAAIDGGAEMGAEVFFLDAVWFSKDGSTWNPTVGDWEVGEVFPDGIGGFRERVHRHGMKFGLWMEPERIGADSAAATTHADFIARGYDGKPSAGHVDLTNPAAAAWLEAHMERLIVEHQLDFFRLDYNTGYLGDGFANERHGYLENHYWRYYQTFYAVVQGLRDRHPDVVFENCASGGARTDLGMVRFFDHTWVTDWQLAPRSVSIVDGLSMVLPPECIDRNIGSGMYGHLRGDIDLQLRQALFGRPTAGGFAPIGGQQHRRSTHNLALYRDFIRPWQPEARVFHHTVGEVSGGWTVLEEAAADRARAIIGLFRLAEGPERYVVRPRGIDAAARYRVTFDNEGSTVEITAAELQNDGISVRLGSTMTSQLLLLERVEPDG